MGSASVQGDLWGADPRGWAEEAESRLQPLYEAVLDRIELSPATRVLDAGCGSGLFVVLAAARGLRAVGLDAAPGLIEYARRRAPTAEFHVADLERLPFADGTFEVVTAFNSVLYAEDVTAALTEFARVTTEGGRVVVTIGAGPEQRTCGEMIDGLTSARTAGNAPVDLRDPNRMEKALLDAGLSVVDQVEVPFTWTFANTDEAVRAQIPAGPVEAAIRNSGRAAVERALRSFFEPRRRPDGTVSMEVVFRYALANRLPN
jgi:SAM-dependent methyltransferase